MSQNSVRAALGVAFLFAASGVAFYFLKADAAKVRSSAISREPAGEGYKPVPVPALPEASLGWKKPETVEDNLWTYDLFTPVEVSWNSSSGEYAPKGLPPEVQVPFGLRLLSIRHPHYRYKVSALFESSNPKESTIVLVDETTGAAVRGRLDQTVGPAGGKIKLLRYDNKPVPQPDGTTLRTVSVTVMDQTLNREIRVTREPIEFGDKTIVVFCGDGSLDPVWTAEKIGDKFDNEAGSYVIKGIDFAGRSVTVEKTLPESSVKKAPKTAVETLSPVAPSAPAPAPAPASAGGTAGSNGVGGPAKK